MIPADARTLKKGDDVYWGDDRSETGIVMTVTDHAVYIKWADGSIGVHSFSNMQNIYRLQKEGQNDKRSDIETSSKIR